MCEFNRKTQPMSCQTHSNRRRWRKGYIWKKLNESYMRSRAGGFDPLIQLEGCLAGCKNLLFDPSMSARECYSLSIYLRKHSCTRIVFDCSSVHQTLAHSYFWSQLLSAANFVAWNRKIFKRSSTHITSQQKTMCTVPMWLLDANPFDDKSRNSRWD